MIIFVGNKIKGGFVNEVAGNPKINQEVTFIPEKPHIKDQKSEILIAAAQGAKSIIYDIDQYYDDPKILIEEIIAIQKTNNAQPILLAPTTNVNNQVIAAALDHGLKRFINAASSMTEQKEELINCLTGYYDANGREDVERIKKKNEKKQIKVVTSKTIGIAGTCHRIGTTTQAIQIIKHIQGKGYTACYVEVNSTTYPNLKLSRKEKPYLSFVEKTKLSFELDREDELMGLITCEGVDMYYLKEHLSSILEKNYNFVVYDYGIYSDIDFNKTSFLKDDFNFMVTGAGTVELDYTLDIISNLSYSKTDLIFSFTAKNDQEDFLNFISEYGAADRCYFTEYTPNPFVLSNTELYDKILCLENKTDESNKKKLLELLGWFKKGEGKNGKVR